METNPCIVGRERERERERAHLFQLVLQHRHHVLLNKQMRLVQILDDDVVVGAVEVHDDGLDGRLALDEHTCGGSVQPSPADSLHACMKIVARTPDCSRHLVSITMACKNSRKGVFFKNG